MSAHQPDPAAAAVAPDPTLQAAALRAGLSAPTAHALARGAAIYRQGWFWEAHEEWEGAWLEEEDAPRALLQGLIQVAAAFHKALVQRQAGGCVRLLTMALEKLAPLGSPCGGVDVAAVRAGAEQAPGPHFQNRARREPRPAGPINRAPQKRPQIRDWSADPTGPGAR